MKCPNCYREVPKQAQVCPSCDARLQAEAPVQAPPLPAQPVLAQQPALAGTAAQPAAADVLPDAGSCSLCEQPLAAGAGRLVKPPKRGIPPAAICERCAGEVQVAFEQETRDANLGMAALFGIAAAVGGALAWYASVVITGYQLGIAALGIGWLIGGAVALGAGRKRGRPLQLISIGLTLVSMVAAQYLILNHLLQRHEGFSITLGQFFQVYPALLREEPAELFFMGIAAWFAWSRPAPRRLELL